MQVESLCKNLFESGSLCCVSACMVLSERHSCKFSSTFSRWTEMRPSLADVEFKISFILMF